MQDLTVVMLLEKPLHLYLREVPEADCGCSNKVGSMVWEITDGPKAGGYIVDLCADCIFFANRHPDTLAEIVASKIPKQQNRAETRAEGN